MDSSLIQIIVEVIVGIGVISVGFGYVYAQFSQGRKNSVKEDIDTENSLTLYLKNQLETFKGIVEDQNKKISDMGKELASLKAVIDEKDKTIDKYLAILQNRNPEITTFMDESKTRQEKQIEIMNEIKSFMNSINKHMETHNKDLKIESTITQK